MVQGAEKNGLNTRYLTSSNLLRHKEIVFLQKKSRFTNFLKRHHKYEESNIIFYTFAVHFVRMRVK